MFSSPACTHPTSILFKQPKTVRLAFENRQFADVAIGCLSGAHEQLCGCRRTAKGVWSWPPMPGVKPADWRCRPSRARHAVIGKRRRQSKYRECRIVSAYLWRLTRMLSSAACEAAGARRIRHSLRPPSSEGRSIRQNRAYSRRGNAVGCAFAGYVQYCHLGLFRRLCDPLQQEHVLRRLGAKGDFDRGRDAGRVAWVVFGKRPDQSAR